MRFRTACGGTLQVPQKTRAHLLAHPGVSDLLSDAAALVTLPLDGSFLATKVEMGRVVGRSGCVSAPRVDQSSPADFALRIGRAKPSRVLVGVDGPLTTKVVVLAFAAREPRTYVLVTSFAGELAPKEPCDPSLAPGQPLHDAVEFWSSHALVYDRSVMGPVGQSCWADVLI